MSLFSRKPDPVEPQGQTTSGPDSTPSKDADIPLFGVRGKAKELAAEVASLRAQLTELGAMEIVDLERRRETLAMQLRSEQERFVEQQAANERELAQQRLAALKNIDDEMAKLLAERGQLQQQLEELRAGVVVTEELTLLQEAGIYEYHHPLDDSVAYKAELQRLKDAYKTMTKANGGAVQATTDWTVNGSKPQGRKMVRDFSKLMLRAYNAEADTLVRGLKPYKLASAVDRLEKVRETIAKLGATMSIRIGDEYHRLRVRELQLTADYQEKLAEEKERDREEKERLREERKAQLELEREKAKLDKERLHYENALAALRAQGDVDGVARLEDQLADVQRRIDDVDYRAANIRAGYVYVISNLGSFGDNIIKVGMTRRLEPMDRVRELGDASVPFRFDVHALFFSDDAVGIEAKMHQRLAAKRVNRVNLRREFFYATPGEAKEILAELAGELLQYQELAEAIEYRQSQQTTADAA
jgi:Domain of unknown function (DUF4041)/T5orf172 domain